MIFRSPHPILRSFGRSVLSMALVGALLPVFAARGLAFPQSDQDRSFKQAVQDYNSNRFADAQAKFEQIQGTHAQEAQQYIAKIKAYTAARTTADDIMRRTQDELDRKSVDTAIQQYEKAI